MCSLNILKTVWKWLSAFLTELCLKKHLFTLSYPKVPGRVRYFLPSRLLILNSSINPLLSRISENTSVLLLVEATPATKKNPTKQSQTKTHCSYKLHDQAVHPWNCVNWIGRETILREASKAKPSGVNTPGQLIVSHEDEYHLLAFSRSFLVCLLSAVLHLECDVLEQKLSFVVHLSLLCLSGPLIMKHL